MKALFAFTLAALFSLTGCGGDEDFTIDDDATVFIVEYTFTPTTITAPAGSAVFFYNLDDTPHRILSQTDNDTFDDTGVIDSLLIPAGDIGVVSISSTAVSGAAIPFYDGVLEDAMATPNGIITVE